MPAPYCLPPGWERQVEYHGCSYRGCSEQACFVLLLSLDPPTHRYLCLRHERELEYLQEQFVQERGFWGRRDGLQLYERLHLVDKEKPDFRSPESES